MSIRTRIAESWLWYRRLFYGERAPGLGAYVSLFVGAVFTAVLISVGWEAGTVAGLLATVAAPPFIAGVIVGGQLLRQWAYKGLKGWSQRRAEEFEREGQPRRRWNRRWNNGEGLT